MSAPSRFVVLREHVGALRSRRRACSVLQGLLLILYAFGARAGGVVDSVGLTVADLDRSVRFYTEVFGMEVIAREPRANAAFLRSPRSGNHHDLGLFGVGDAGGPKRRGAIGLYHLAWQLDTIDELAVAKQVLIDTGAYTGESSHGATKSVYGADPDGIEFELMWMLPREHWGDHERSAPIERLDLDREVARWSGVRTAVVEPVG